MLTINTSFVRILTGGCKTLVDERKLGQFWPHPDVNLGNVGLNVSSKKELKRLYLGRSLFGVADFNWHYRCRTYRGQDRLVAGKIPSTGCCPDYLPGSELERDRLPRRRVRYLSTCLPSARAHRTIGEGTGRSKSCYRNCFFKQGSVSGLHQ